MTVKDIAIHDIKDALKQESRSFFAFNTDLNPVIDEIIEDYTMEQKKPKTKPHFKPGDTLVPKPGYRGIEQSTVTSVDDKNYYLKIPCGTAILPISAQVNYKLNKKK